MEQKKRYYVSVQAGTVMESQGDSSYEFEINASEAQVEALKSLFAQRTEYEYGTFLRSHIVAMPYHYDEENDLYDACLQQIYYAIAECGTEETTNHIRSMGFC
ncbi:hypothetical protein [Brevibacillus centrosporus]|uniref:hypothetical protein n=1 Tax=Brevibacillus centrosporus TaxID=54910 RepID=UPI0038078E19